MDRPSKGEKVLMAQSTRKDPPRQPVDGLTPHNAVKNPKEGYHYVLVDRAGTGGASVEYYEMLGWQAVEYTGDKGTRLAYGRWKEGDLVGNMGQVLMEMSPERWEELEQHGSEGNNGQLALDRLAQQIRAQGFDPVRSRAGIGAKQVSSSHLGSDLDGFLTS